MASTSVCSSLPHRLLVVLYPVISLCQASVVRATLAEMNLDDGSKRLVFSVVDLCNWRLEPFAASASGADEDEDGREDWRLLVMALLLTLVGLKRSQVGSFSTAVRGRGKRGWIQGGILSLSWLWEYLHVPS